MRKSLIVTSLVSIAVMSATPIIAQAEQDLDDIITCPTTLFDDGRLINYGNYIAGQGTEVLQGVTTRPLFMTKVMPPNVFTDLTGYASTGTYYDSKIGAVKCFYVSEAAGADPFEVQYILPNGNGATAIQATANSIHLKLRVGLKS